MATTVVELALEDPVNDQNFFRNGNFYSSFWKTPAGVTCPAGVWTTNASYWLCQPDVTSPFSSLTASFVQPAVLGTTSATLTAAFTQPAANATVSIAVTATAWMAVNQTITIAGGGEYTVSSITDGTHAVVKNLGLTGNAAPAASVPTGGAVGPTALVTISVGATAWMSPTQQIYIVGGGDYQVSSVPDGTHAIVANLGHPSNVLPGATVQSGGGMSPLAAAVTFLRSTQVPDIYSLFSAKLQGAGSVAAVEFGQQINGDLSATLRRNCTFSGYIYNSSGLVAAPKLNFYTADAFNNFSSMTLWTTVNVQSAPTNAWTFMSATLDLSAITNITNGLFIAVLIPSGTLNDPSKFVLFSRLKFQIGEVATEFVDDTSLFIQAPSVDSTMLQDGCIARPSLFMPLVVPKGAYVAKSIENGDINDGAIDGRTMVPSVSTTLSAGFTQPAVSSTVPIAVSSTTGFLTGQRLTIAGGGTYTIFSVTDATHMVVTNTGVSGNVAPASTVPTGGAVSQVPAAITNLGYTPIKKSGDTAIGPGQLTFSNEASVGASTYANAAIGVNGTSANATNDGYMPAISFLRPTRWGRAVGLDINGKFKTVDTAGTVGYLLDTVTKVDTNSYQDGSITYQKLAQSLINLICPVGEIRLFAGPNPPGGWFVCEGQWVSRTTYAALFTAIGTYWGVADGTVNFALPDFRGRVPLGYNGANAGFSGFGFGGYVGEERHALSTTEMPSHTHPMNHTHSYISLGGGNGIASGNGWAPTSATTGDISTGMQSAGGNASHNNLQPSAVLYYIIKAT
jgi:microcystin-dependent protein